jgi:hypothetical protein
MERKYKQRGYMDSGGSGSERSERAPAKRPETFGPKTPKMPGKREVVRCAACGTVLPTGIDFTAKCPHCNAELHSCKQCSYFDAASRFECTQPVSARIPRKDARNQCNFYLPRTTIERETSTSKPLDARQAFENLFRK